MNTIPLRLSLLSLTAAFVTTIFTFGEGGGQTFQILSVTLLGMAAFFTFYNGIKLNYSLTFIEGLFIASTIYSLGVTLFIGDGYTVLYSLIMFFVVISVIVLLRGITFEQLLTSTITAFIIIIIIDVIGEYELLIDSLSVTITDQGLVRFSPFGMHPNLVGLVFGTIFIFLIATTFNTNKRLLKYLLAIFAFISLIFVFAASSRASILGLFIASTLVLVKTVDFKVFFRKEVWVTLIIAPLFILLFFDQIYSWLTGILEFESDTRGVSAGASGRTGIWADGISLFLNDTSRFIWGHGYRSIYDIGFPTENSYINILLELGIVCGGSIILAIFYITLASYLKLQRSERFYKKRLTFYTAMLIFVISQSFFNRYLVGIGNITSLVVLFLLFSWRKHVP